MIVEWEILTLLRLTPHSPEPQNHRIQFSAISKSQKQFFFPFFHNFSYDDLKFIENHDLCSVYICSTGHGHWVEAA